MAEESNAIFRSDDDSEDEDDYYSSKERSLVPRWAQERNLQSTLEQQTTIDPDDIFQSSSQRSLNLEGVCQPYCNIGEF